MGGATNGSVSAGGTGGGACSGAECTDPPSSCYESAGTCVNGTCSYGFADGVSCDDGDACTTGDTCASGMCGGTRMACTTPPAPACMSVTTLRTYDAAGTCAAGACSYSFVDGPCASACIGGVCSPAVASISAGEASTCAVLGRGALKCWGSNASGELGDNSMTDSLVPVDVTGLPAGVLAVSAARYACALTLAGGVKCWGWNTASDMLGTTISSLVPVDVTGLSSGVIAVSSNYDGACALTSAGAVQCWGNNAYGQLGNGSTAASSIPVDVTGLSSGIIAISKGRYHACALTSAGAVKCWGISYVGPTGSNSWAQTTVPVDVTGLSSGVIAISAGHFHNCALTFAGGVKCWGSNYSGELGNNSYTFNLDAGDVMGLSSGVVAISAGYDHTCALTSAGGVQCWGANINAMDCGGANPTISPVPVDIPALSSGIVAVSAGGSHNCALTSAGVAKCWGCNLNGRLGNNSTTESPVPVDVVGL